MVPAAGRWPAVMRTSQNSCRVRRPLLPGMFWRFTGLARDCGAVTFELQRSRVVLRGSKRIFASVRVSARGCCVRPAAVRSTRRGRRQAQGGLIPARRFRHARSSKPGRPKGGLQARRRDTPAQGERLNDDRYARRGG
jgi:hypothetical protein